MAPFVGAAGTGRWSIRKDGRRWAIYDPDGLWRMETSYWWLAMWAVTRDWRHVPDDQHDLARMI